MSEEVKQNERRENQGGMNTEGGDPQRDQNSRNGYRNSRRRHSSRPIGRDQRTNTIEIQPKGAERPVNPNNPAPGNRNNPRRENQPQQRRNNFPQDQRPSGGAPDRGPKPAGAREHIVKEIGRTIDKTRIHNKTEITVNPRIRQIRITGTGNTRSRLSLKHGAAV